MCILIPTYCGDHTWNNGNEACAFATKSSVIQLQKIQNKALKFITNTKWDEFRSIQSLHQQANIDPINIVIYNKVKSTWQQFQTNLPYIYRNLIENHPPNRINN